MHHGQSILGSCCVSWCSTHISQSHRGSSKDILWSNCGLSVVLWGYGWSYWSSPSLEGLRGSLRQPFGGIERVANYWPHPELLTAGRDRELCCQAYHGLRIEVDYLNNSAGNINWQLTTDHLKMSTPTEAGPSYNGTSVPYWPGRSHKSCTYRCYSPTWPHICAKRTEIKHYISPSTPQPGRA